MWEDIINFFTDYNSEYPFNIQMSGISYCDGTYKIERKNSPIYVFEYILKGQGTVIINNNQEYVPIEGDVYILHRGDDHLYYSNRENPWTKIWFNFYGPLADQLIQLYQLNTTYYIKNFDMKDDFYRMLEIVRQSDINTKEIFEKAAIIFHEMLIKMSNRIQHSESVCFSDALKLKYYIDQHAEENISIQKMSDRIFKSQSQTIRIFKKEFGITPYEYLLNKKIEIAKLLLMNTNMRVKEIAFKLSFADEHYFSNYFKYKTGVSPRMYAKMIGKKLDI